MEKQRLGGAKALIEERARILLAERNIH